MNSLFSIEYIRRSSAMSPFDAALPSTEDLFSVIEAIHDNVAIVDHNGVMRWVSSCFERNYGISATGSSAGHL